MLIELLSTSNYVSYNIKLAELLGLHSAIYLSEIMNINDKAIRKDKLHNSGILLDREYITKRTTLSVEEQLDLDTNLIKLGILERPDTNENCLVLHLNVLTTLMTSADEDLQGSVQKLMKIKDKSKPRKTKAEAIRDNLKSNIVETNAELVVAYSDWIDAVYAKEGWMSKKAVILGQSVVNEFANHDLDVALNLLSIAALHGHRDISWSISKYKEQYKVKREIKPSSPATHNPGVYSEVF